MHRDPVVMLGVLTLALIALGLAGSYIARAKRRPPAEGFLFGLLLGPLGLLIEALLPTTPLPPRRPVRDGRPDVGRMMREIEDEDRAAGWLSDPRRRID